MKEIIEMIGEDLQKEPFKSFLENYKKSSLTKYEFLDFWLTFNKKRFSKKINFKFSYTHNHKGFETNETIIKEGIIDEFGDTGCWSGYYCWDEINSFLREKVLEVFK